MGPGKPCTPALPGRVRRSTGADEAPASAGNPLPKEEPFLRRVYHHQSMQRRAVAVAAALFLVVGALSLGLVLTSEAPGINAEADNVYQAGDEFTVGDRTYTVASIEASESSGGGHGGGGGTTYEAVIEWNNESMNGTQSASVGQHGNVTLSGETFFAHFDSGEEVVISSDFQTLRQYNTETERFEDHTNGLWGATILTGITAIVLTGMGYMPSRY
jgi:hypothetical protein